MNVVARAALGFAAMLLALGAAAVGGQLDPGPGGCCTKPPLVAGAPATFRLTALAAR